MPILCIDIFTTVYSALNAAKTYRTDITTKMLAVESTVPPGDGSQKGSMAIRSGNSGKTIFALENIFIPETVVSKESEVF